MKPIIDAIKAEVAAGGVAEAIADALMSSDDLWKAIEDQVNHEVQYGGLYLDLDEGSTPVARFIFGDQGEAVTVPLKQLLSDWDAGDLDRGFELEKLEKMKKSCEHFIAWMRGFKLCVEAAIDIKKTRKAPHPQSSPGSTSASKSESSSPPERPSP
jgi:hypothetical protein